MSHRTNAFFNLNVTPFGETPDPRFFFESEVHRNAFEMLNFAIRQGKGFSLLTGEVGTGKTLITRMILGSLDKTFHSALILNSNFNEVELLQSICEEFEIDFSAHSQSPVGSWKYYLDHFYSFLLSKTKMGEKTVLIIDEAQNLDTKNIEAIRMLSNLETENKKILQIILVGQPELQTRLELPDLRQLKQRICIEAALTPLNLLETQNYIKYRLDRAGGANLVRFERSAFDLIHKISGGIPRNINRICERLLIESQVSEKRLVDKSDVKKHFSKDLKKLSYVDRLFRFLPYSEKNPP